MKPSKIIEKELQEIAPILARIDKTNFYTVEERYFAESYTQIIGMVDSVGIEPLPPILSGIEKKELYPAPSFDYFDSFSDSIISYIHADEVVEELSFALPLLQKLAKKELYRRPDTAYFASFPDTITAMASRETKEHDSQIELWGRRWISTAQKVLDIFARPRYSFAMASVVGIIMCITLVMNNRTLSKEDKIFAQMQQIPDADLHHYVAGHRDEFDEHILLHDINNVDFTHYFDKPEQVTPHIEDHIRGASDDEAISDEILD